MWLISPPGIPTAMIVGPEKGKHILSPLCGCGSKAKALHVIEALESAGIGYNPEDVGTFEIFGEKLYQTTDGGPLAHPDLEIAGRISVMHIFSDLFAKGLSPVSLAISVEHPPDASPADLGLLIGSMRNRAKEEGAVLVNGHTSIAQDWRVHGFATGRLMPASTFLAKNGAKLGDKLFLSKPVGSGRMLRLLTLGLIGEKDFAFVAESMLQSNRQIGRLASHLGCSASSDVTGFGLLGTLVEMLDNTLGAQLILEQIPCFALPRLDIDLSCIEAAYLERGNKEFVLTRKSITGKMKENALWPVFSPETSGGLLIAANPEFEAVLLAQGCTMIGNVTATNSILIT